MDGIDGTVTKDADGNENALRVNAGTLSTTSHESKFFSFRLKKTVVWPVYLRIRATAAWALDDSVYIDDVAVAKGQELYTGGPFMAAFSGKTTPVVGDKWTLAATNNRGGLVQEHFQRFFDMSTKGLLLPVTGTTQITNSVVS